MHFAMIVSCLLLIAGFTASASPLPFTTDYNVLVFTDMTGNNLSIGGSVAVARDATFTGVSVASGNNGSSGAAPNSGAGAMNLIVGDDLSWNGGQLVAGNGVHGGLGSISGVGVPGGVIGQGATPVNFAALQTQAQNAATSFAAMTTNGSTDVAPWGGITLTGIDTGLNIFTVAATNLSSTSYLNIVAPSGSGVLINVVGNAASIQNAGINLNGQGFNYNSNAADWQNVLWNFTGTGTLQVSGVSLGGSILAPYGSVNVQFASLNGDIVANSLSASGGINNFAFNGTEPEDPSAVPEPGTLLLSALGSTLILGRMALRSRAN